MKQIKTFYAYNSINNLDDEVNAWLIENKDFSIIDIKYQYYKSVYSVLIIYDKGIQI